MLNVSFKSIWALPNNNKINSSRKEFISLTERMSNGNVHDRAKDIYYVNVKDCNDRNFLRCAGVYGVKVQKANKDDLKEIKVHKTDAEWELEYIIKLMSDLETGNGNIYSPDYTISIKNNGNGIKTLSIQYKKIWESYIAKQEYVLDLNKDNHNKLMKLTNYEDEEPFDIYEFDNEGTKKLIWHTDKRSKHTPYVLI